MEGLERANSELERTNNELERTNCELERTNCELERSNRDRKQMQNKIELQSMLIAELQSKKCNGNWFSVACCPQSVT